MLVKRCLSLRQTLILIALTLFLLITGTILLLLPISETGYSREQITLDTPRHFSDLTYTIDNNNVSFSDGGYLVPILHKSEPMALAIYGYGKIVTKGSVYETKDCLLIMPQSMYYDLMNQLYLQTSDETVFIDKTNDALTKMYNYMPFIVTPTGKKFFSFPNNFKAIMLLDNNAPIKGLIKNNSHSLKSFSFALITLGYCMIFLAVLGIIILLTNKRHQKVEKESFYFCKPSPSDFRFHMAFIILIWIGLACTTTDSYIKSAYLVGSLVYSLVYLLLNRDIYSGHLRVQFSKFVKYLPLNALFGLILFVISTTALPVKYNSFSSWFNGNMIYKYVLIIWISFLVFSYLLYEIERHLSMKKCLILLLVLSNIAMFTILYLSGVTLAFSILNALLFTSLYFVIAAALVLRTNNAFSVAFALIIALTLTMMFL